MPGEKILVVDDDEEIVYLCVQILESEGYRVKGINNGLTAIDMAKEDHFDLLITDIMMPGLNGMEIFRAIRKYDPELVGVVITGHGTLHTAIDALKMGFHGFLTKPFSYVELSTAVSQALERSKLEKELIAYRRIDKLKDDFLAIISHELRTPLSLILTSIDLLTQMRREQADEKERETLEILKREGSRLARLISNMLLYSELKFQKVKHPRENVNLINITEKVLESVRNEAQKKNITIENQLPEDIPDFLCVSRHIKQIVTNFVDNAIKFNREGGKVFVKGKIEGNLIQFEVGDTGIGIDKDNYDKIFDPFQQLEDPMTRKIGGTGLGLAINKEIIEAHGGNIHVESDPGKGSTFMFTLPITDNSFKPE
ncbi:MAG: response regulator [Thermodesulfobacteriota bacterium]|nr:response regulator [Thermodesulfobacteriota bacterium]